MLKFVFHTRKFCRRIFDININPYNFTPNIWTICAMDGQKKISSYFASPVRSTSVSTVANGNQSENSKRPLSTSSEAEDETTAKRLKVQVSPKYETSNGPLTENNNVENGVLSDDVRSKIEENRLAKIKLVTSNTRGLIANIDPSWFRALEAEFSKPYFSDLAKFVEEERKKYTVYPASDEVFSWTCMTPVKKTKVVILGQDPYHGVNQAHGLCFSVKKGVASPPSLENMFKELKNDIDGFVSTNHGCLSGWAEQGVLLLNAVLTVRAHNANSHKDRGWEKLTDAVVSHLNKNSSGIVFILWGAYAQKKGSQIDKKKHHVLHGPHPSPLSAHRGFFGCKHFSRCNELLKKDGKTPINWSHLP